MVVGVDEPREHEPAARVDPLGVRARPVGGLRVRAHPDDPPVAHGEGFGLGQLGVDGVDAGSGEEQIGGGGV